MKYFKEASPSKIPPFAANKGNTLIILTSNITQIKNIEVLLREIKIVIKIIKENIK